MGYKKIIKGFIAWPPEISAIAKDFMTRLLEREPCDRLGCLKGGSADVRTHQWFRGLDFAALEAREVPAPYVPSVKSGTDDSNFDYYDVDEGKLNYPGEFKDRKMFKDFADEWV